MQTVTLFNNDPALVTMASAALPIFAVSFLFMSVNLNFTAYFYSTKQTGKANIIAISRGVVIKALAIFLLPALWGSSSVWHAVIVSEAATCIICLVLLRKNTRPPVFQMEQSSPSIIKP